MKKAIRACARGQRVFVSQMMRLTVVLLAPLLTAPLQAQERAVVFTNVRVIPMDRERVLEDQTVVVRGDRIAEIGPAAAIRAPAHAGRGDARGSPLPGRSPRCGRRGRTGEHTAEIQAPTFLLF